MRLNRANATMRDQDRLRGLNGQNTVQDEACESIWRELVANWKRRTQLVEYCVSVVDQSLTEKRAVLEDQTQDESSRRRTQGEMYADQVKRKQVRNELSVESIVRKRSADAFTSRCKYFVPPQTDTEARKMWEAAERGD
ncbi:caffeine-induced death protein 2 [Gymnopilus junonius]|uniref:Caffeine-induced death protein 2 n=1 Tax=Gymnopilus junonius TaxID=109634 RepID=A0A9P5P1J4_GYMJU|nr:caffeine-induced death protein 2 [Gymnopilus junonius]